MSGLQYEKRKRQKLEAQLSGAGAGPSRPSKRGVGVADPYEAIQPQAKRVKNKVKYEPKKGKKAAAPPVPVAASDESDEEGEEEDQDVSAEELEADSDDMGSEEEEEEIGAMSGESDSDSDDEDASEGEVDENGEEGSGEEDSEDEDIPVKLEDCLESPLYTIAPPESDVENADAIFAYKACVLCPGKLLKNQKMVDTHLGSNSHMRAKKRMATRLLDPDSLTSADPREIVAEIEEELESQRNVGQSEKPKSAAKGKAAKSANKDDKNKGNSSKKTRRENKVALRIQARKERKAARQAEGAKAA